MQESAGAEGRRALLVRGHVHKAAAKLVEPTGETHQEVMPKPAHACPGNLSAGQAVGTGCGFDTDCPPRGSRSGSNSLRERLPKRSRGWGVVGVTIMGRRPVAGAPRSRCGWALSWPAGLPEPPTCAPRHLCRPAVCSRTGIRRSTPGRRCPGAPRKFPPG